MRRQRCFRIFSLCVLMALLGASTADAKIAKPRWNSSNTAAEPPCNAADRYTCFWFTLPAAELATKTPLVPSSLNQAIWRHYFVQKILYLGLRIEAAQSLLQVASYLNNTANDARKKKTYLLDLKYPLLDITQEDGLERSAFKQDREKSASATYLDISYSEPYIVFSFKIKRWYLSPLDNPKAVRAEELSPKLRAILTGLEALETSWNSGDKWKLAPYEDDTLFPIGDRSVAIKDLMDDPLLLPIGKLTPGINMRNVAMIAIGGLALAASIAGAPFTGGASLVVATAVLWCANSAASTVANVWSSEPEDNKPIDLNDDAFVGVPNTLAASLTKLEVKEGAKAKLQLLMAPLSRLDNQYRRLSEIDRNTALSAEQRTFFTDLEMAQKTYAATLLAKLATEAKTPTYSPVIGSAGLHQEESLTQVMIDSSPELGRVVDILKRSNKRLEYLIGDSWTE